MDARIFFIKARAANQAVIFRRGPSRWVQMINWDLNTDRLEFGQWVKKKIPVRNCDLSPSGKYLIYTVDNFEHMPSRTVISRPPYWTAIAAWEHGDRLYGTGGGLFDQEHAVALNLYGYYNVVPHQNWPVPPFVSIGMVKMEREYNLWKGQINLLLFHRMERDGWTEMSDEAFVARETVGHTDKNPSDFFIKHYPNCTQPIEPKLWKKEISGSVSLCLITFYHFERRRNFNAFYLDRKGEKTKLEGIDWADTDDRNRIIATKEGKLYASKIFRDGSVAYTELELLFDLNPQSPARILTPKSHKSWE